MPTPYERALLKDYLRRWTRKAWSDTWRFEARWGLRVGLLAAIISGLLAWSLGGVVVSLPLLLWTIIGGVVGVWLLAFLCAWYLAPAWLDLQRTLDEEGDDSGSLDRLQSLSTDPHEPSPSIAIVEWPTRGGQRIVYLEGTAGQVGWPISAIRFIKPREKIIQRSDSLPLVLKLPRILKLFPHGRIIIKEIRDNGMKIEEQHTRGVMVRAEVYRVPPS